MCDERAGGEPSPDEPPDPHEPQRLLLLQARIAELRDLTRDLVIAADVIDTAFSYQACINMGDTLDVLTTRAMAACSACQETLAALPPVLSEEATAALVTWRDEFHAMKAARAGLRALLHPVAAGDAA